MILYKNIPNFITLIRILIAPIIFYFIVNEIFIAAIVFFTIGSISDFLDGYIARNYNLVSKFGKYFDPIADKLFILSGFISLAIICDYVQLWMIIIILLRDAIITICRFYLKNRNFSIQANLLGKSKTLFQISTILISLILLQLFTTESLYLIEYLMIICVAITCFSGINYLYKYFTLLIYEN